MKLKALPSVNLAIWVGSSLHPACKQISFDGRQNPTFSGIFVLLTLLPVSQLQFISAFPSCQSLLRLALHSLPCLFLSKPHLKLAICSKTAQKSLIKSKWISTTGSSTPQQQILHEEMLFYAPASPCTWLQYLSSLPEAWEKVSLGNTECAKRRERAVEQHQ